MAIDSESFDLLVAAVQRFVRERLVPAEDRWKKSTRCPPTSSTT